MLPLRQQDSINDNSDYSNMRQRNVSSRQQQILRDIRRHEREEARSVQQMQDYGRNALSKEAAKYVQTILLILVIGGVALVVYSPKTFYKILTGNKVQLPNRKLLTIYPADIAVRDAFPRFMGQWSLASAENEVARQRVHHYADNLKKFATDPLRYSQKIALHAWEFLHFERQMNSRGELDDFCGPNFATTYHQYSSKTSADIGRKDMVAWCLMRRGYHDGYVDFGLFLEGALTRGTRGVAVLSQETDEAGNTIKRIDSSLMLLPVLTTAQRQSNVTLVSTNVPDPALQWLREHAIRNDDERLSFEAHLYTLMEPELAQSWYILTKICDVDGKQRYDAQFRRIAVHCRPHVECCHIYDEQQKPFVPRD